MLKTSQAHSFANNFSISRSMAASQLPGPKFVQVSSLYAFDRRKHVHI